MYQPSHYADPRNREQYRTWGGSAQEGYPNYRDERARRRMRSMNFEEYASDGNRIINEVSHEIGCDRNSAARIFKAVLHAVRDRLPASDAIEFAQGLPMVLKGVFIDQYDMSSAPVVIRHVGDFIDFVRSKNRAADIDFPDDRSSIHCIKAVFRVLERNMDPGQVEQIKYMINQEVRDLLN